MKVYGLRTAAPDSAYRPVIGWHTSLQSAKSHAKTLFNRTAPFEVVEYEIKDRFTLGDIVDLLNGDSISGDLEGTMPRDYLVFRGLAFENAAMKRAKKEKRE